MHQRNVKVCVPCGSLAMAAGARCSSNTGEAEKLYRLAEERFLASDVAGALRAAREAQMHSRSLPGLANALAAYEVHAAAAASRASGRNWYAVLGVGGRSLTTSGGVITHDAIKQRYRRLCLVLHPDKNGSAAADGAFKLLQEAWATLSARHPPNPAATVKPSAEPTPVARSRTGAKQPRPARTARPHASSASAAKPSDSRPPPPASSAYDPKTEKRRASNPPPACGGDSFYSWTARQGSTPRVFRSVTCHRCGLVEFRVADADDEASAECIRCHQLLRPPRQSKPPPASTEYTEPPPRPAPPPPRGRGGSRFPCPALCPRCRTPYAAMVSVGMWHLECMACHKYAMVHVRSRCNADTL